MAISPSLPWSQLSFVALDLETTGVYPLGSYVCEIGAVLWKEGKVQDKFKTLVKPPCTLSEQNIQIHKITNEMLKDSPSISEVIKDFFHFTEGHVLVGHHIPFDLGFIAYEFEKHNLKPDLDQPLLCSSLISRKLIPEAKNHKLQTLVKHFNFNSNISHRALEDAENSLLLLLECLKRAGDKISLDDILKIQEKKLTWQNFSIQELNIKPDFINAIKENKKISLLYKKVKREVFPQGLVRTPDGDFLACKESLLDEHIKRLYLNKVSFL